MIKRNLDPCFFDIERDGTFKKVCFSDSTYMERDNILDNCTEKELKDLCNKLADALNFIGDYYNIYFTEENS